LPFNENEIALAEKIGIQKDFMVGFDCCENFSKCDIIACVKVICFGFGESPVHLDVLICCVCVSLSDRKSSYELRGSFWHNAQLKKLIICIVKDDMNHATISVCIGLNFCKITRKAFKGCIQGIKHWLTLDLGDFLVQESSD